MTVFSFILMLVAYTYEYNYFTEGKKMSQRKIFQNINFSDNKKKASEDNGGYKDND